ncbi:MAG: flagellar basal-body rod protein FlgF [Deltaproteobacteria bacterium]|nr:flagellar basal-body rod protein FlgF [Deltaproteobacteria bacterium]
MSLGVQAAIEVMGMKERQLEALSHNIANANTTGFKEEQLRFEAKLEEALKKDPTYVPQTEKVIDFSQGALVPTNNPYDVALQGSGFLEVQNEQGTFYTRNGALTTDAAGNLKTAAGAQVIGQSGPIQITKDGKVDISKIGEITINGESIAKLKVVDFDDKSKLSSVGASLYQAPNGTQPKVLQNPFVVQGSQESSNVNTIKNLSQLIEVNRQYEAYQRVVRMQDKMNQDAPATLGRLS